MNDIDIEARVQEMFRGGDEEIAVEATESAVEAPQPVDMYQQASSTRKAQYKPRTQGSRPMLGKYLPDVLSRIRPAYEKAKDDCEYAEKIGDKERARMIRQQYMEDYYLPAVDATVRLSSKQDLLSSRDALGELDQLTLVEGNRGSGYTAAFVTQMYEDGQQPIISDGVVRDAVKRIQALCFRDQIRAAVGLAKSVKEKIDSGENIAIPEDYEMIQRVALRG